MIESIGNGRYVLFWLPFHVVLGLLSTTSAIPLIAWLYIVLAIDGFSLIAKIQSSAMPLNRIMLYTISFEVLCRMAKTTPIIPYEMGKYLSLGFLTYGILVHHNKGRVGWLMLALVLPAVIYDDSNEVTVNNIIFNLLGCVNLALAVVYFKNQKVTEKELKQMITLMIYPLITALVFTFIKTPDYDTIDFTLSANFSTSGGFGSNQVSTIFGLGLFLTFILWLTNSMVSGTRLIDIGIMVAFAFMGLLTFSRGGMIGSMLGIATILGYLTFSGKKIAESHRLDLTNIAIYVIPVMLMGIIIFQVVNDISGEKLVLRYKGETAGTLAGMKEVDLNTITSNRYEILTNDLELWKDNILLGTGVGSSMYLRETIDDTAAHVEMSRLLAEHGFFGLLYFVILCVLPFQILKHNKETLYRAILLSLFAIAFYTTFHSAMRTYVTPLLVGVSMLTISNKPLLTRSKKMQAAQWRITFRNKQ